MDPKEIQRLYDSLKLVRKGSEDDYEIRSSADEKVWGVKSFSESPTKPTYVLYAGPEAKELAADLGDLDLEEQDGDEDEDDEADESEDDADEA